MDYIESNPYNGKQSMAVVHPSAKQQSSFKPSVLYVEDNAINSKVVMFGLRGAYDVSVAVDAQEACELMRTSDGRFVAILMDIELQGSDLDGIELTRLFRGKLDTDGLPEYAVGLPVTHVPIIIVTAYLERYPEDYLSDAGASACLGKPVDLSGLRLLLADLRGS